MDFFTTLNEILSHFNEWLSLKFLAFIAFFTCLLSFIGDFPFFRDKLNPMYDSIVPYLKKCIDYYKNNNKVRIDIDFNPVNI